MSDVGVECLLVAVRDWLRATNSWANSQCAISPEGRPHPRMGEFFVAIDEAGIQSDGQNFLREIYAIEVTITWRTGRIAPDRYDEIYRTMATAIGRLERLVIAQIRGNQQIRINANTVGGLPDVMTGDVFQTPLWYRGRSRTSVKGSDWVYAASGEHSFLTRTLRFSGGLRVQAPDIQQ